MAICEPNGGTTIATNDKEITMTTKRVTIIQWLYDSILVKEDKLFAEPEVVKPEDYKLSHSMWTSNGKPKHAVITEDKRILFHYAI